MLILRLNAKYFTFVVMMELAGLPNTLFSVPMAPFSTKITSFVTGGSTLTVLKLRPWLRPKIPSFNQNERLLKPD